LSETVLDGKCRKSRYKKTYASGTNEAVPDIFIIGKIGSDGKNIVLPVDLVFIGTLFLTGNTKFTLLEFDLAVFP
jgi:hypothetical protein